MSDDDLIRRGDVLREIANEGLHILDAAIAALPARGVGVRKLEWHEDFADHPFGWYETIDCGDCIVLTQSGVAVGSLPTLDAAKAAAQADYDARIMAALEPAPAPTDDTTEKGGDAHAVDPRHAPHEASPGVTAGADAAQAREAAARLLLDMLNMRNGAHEGVEYEEAQKMWDAASDRHGFAAVDAFLRSIIGEART